MEVGEEVPTPFVLPLQMFLTTSNTTSAEMAVHNKDHLQTAVSERYWRIASLPIVERSCVFSTRSRR